MLKQETNWMSVMPRLALLGCLCLILYQFDRRLFIVYAFFLYLIITYAIKYSLIPASTFDGTKLLRAGRYEEAIPFIQKDINYFSERSWIDRFRFALMISSSSRSFREMSLCNMAYCLLQSGKVKDAKELYENVILQYPENAVAQAQLNTMNIIIRDVQWDFAMAEQRQRSQK